MFGYNTIKICAVCLNNKGNVDFFPGFANRCNERTS